MAKQITDMETWLLDNDTRIFRYLIHKKIFTPYEVERAFMDESVYENNGYYTLALIEEAIDLGHGEWMLSLRSVNDDGEITGIVHCYKLSEIQLSYFDNDQNIELYESEEPDDEL